MWTTGKFDFPHTLLVMWTIRFCEAALPLIEDGNYGDSALNPQLIPLIRRTAAHNSLSPRKTLGPLRPRHNRRTFR